MKKPQNILVVVESIDVNKSSGPKVNIAFINNLVTLGYSVKVLHYTRKDIQLNGAVCINISEQKSSVNFYLSRLQRVFQRITKLDISKKLENSFGNSFTFFNDSKSIQKAIKQHYSAHDLIVTLSQGASFRPHHAMLGLSSLHNKWLAYVHDPYPFHVYPDPYNWSEPGYKLKMDFFKKVSEKAKYSGFPSQLLKEWMGKHYANFLNTGLVIPHQHLETEKGNEISNLDYFNTEKFTLLHAGNLMKQRSPVGLIEGFKLFLEKNIEAREESELMLIGASFDKPLLTNYNNAIAQLYVQMESIPFNQVHYLQQHVNVNIILESKAEISPFLPGKFPQCVMANKPILALGPKHSETKRLLGHDYKFQAEANENEKIASLIETLYKNWKTDKELKLNRPDLIRYLSPSFLDTVLKESVFI